MVYLSRLQWYNLIAFQCFSPLLLRDVDGNLCVTDMRTRGEFMRDSWHYYGNMGSPYLVINQQSLYHRITAIDNKTATNRHCILAINNLQLN